MRNVPYGPRKRLDNAENEQREMDQLQMGRPTPNGVEDFLHRNGNAGGNALATRRQLSRHN
jgi:hypothetical protein